MIADAWTAARPDKPQIEESRVIHAAEITNRVNDDGGEQRPERLGDQEGLDGDDQIEHRIAVGDARKHLRAGQGNADRIGD